jgi:hypothetical protein
MEDVADDNNMQRDLVQERLKFLGFKVRECLTDGNGQWRALAGTNRKRTIAIAVRIVIISAADSIPLPEILCAFGTFVCCNCICNRCSC